MYIDLKKHAEGAWKRTGKLSCYHVQEETRRFCGATSASCRPPPLTPLVWQAAFATDHWAIANCNVLQPFAEFASKWVTEPRRADIGTDQWESHLVEIRMQLQENPNWSLQQEPFDSEQLLLASMFPQGYKHKLNTHHSDSGGCFSNDGLTLRSFSQSLLFFLHIHR